MAIMEARYLFTRTPLIQNPLSNLGSEDLATGVAKKAIKPKTYKIPAAMILRSWYFTYLSLVKTPRVAAACSFQTRIVVVTDVVIRE